MDGKTLLFILSLKVYLATGLAHHHKCLIFFLMASAGHRTLLCVTLSNHYASLFQPAIGGSVVGPYDQFGKMSVIGDSQ